MRAETFQIPLYQLFTTHPTQYRKMTLSLSSLKTIATSIGYTLEDVKPFGDARLKSTWEACVADFMAYHGVTLDQLQAFADGNVSALSELVAPITEIVAPMVEATQQAIEVATPIVTSVIATVYAFVTDPQTHRIAKLHTLKTMIAIIAAMSWVYALGQSARQYYEGIAPLDPMGRVMQLWADLGSVPFPSVDPGWVLSMADDAIDVGITVLQFGALIASITPILWGSFLYNLSEGANSFATRFGESADHYALCRDSVTL